VSETALLTAVLDAEHAAVYAYGVLGAQLDDRTRPLALQAFDASSRGGALALAVRLEEGLSVRWRDLVGGTSDRRLRSLAIGALQETAVRAAVWRQTAGTRPVTVAFPGQA